MKKEEIFKGLPAWSKGVIAISIIAGVVYVVYNIQKSVKKKKAEEGAKKEVDATKQEADALNSNPSTAAKLSKAQMAIYANALFEAMNGYASDEQSIYRVFTNVNNSADLLGVVAAFGIRNISSGSLSLAPDYKGALGGALNTELSPHELTVLNTILSKKGIKYKF